MVKELKKSWNRAKKFITEAVKTKRDLRKQLAGEQKRVEEMAKVQRTPGLTCPQCYYRIEVSISMLLSGGPIVCTACGLKLAVEEEQSRGCLNELRKVNEAIANVEEVKKVSQASSITNYK